MKRITVSVPTIHHVSRIAARCESVKQFSLLALDLTSGDGDSERLHIFFTGDCYDDYVRKLADAINAVKP